MTKTPFGISIGTISGGIVNFGGAGTIAPISVTRTVAGSGEGNNSSCAATQGLRMSPDGTSNRSV